VAYFYVSQPEMQPAGSAGSYQHIEQKAEAAAAQLAHNPQADVDAATMPATNAPATTVPATNAPAAEPAPAN
jgi:hypothetical protein